MMHDWWGWGPGFGGMWLGPLLMLIVVVLLIAGIVALIRWMAGNGSPPQQQTTKSSARDLLDERYARGESDSKEYEERKRALES